MRHKKYKQINAILYIIVFSLIPIFGKSIVNEEDAVKMFKSKHFTEALPFFSEQLKLYPSDTILSYYTGVCLIETSRFSYEAQNLLLKASQGNVPYDVNYFIGKNYHAMNFFESALTYYNQFKEFASKKEIKEFELKEKISMCQNKINPFITVNTNIGENEKSDSLVSPVVTLEQISMTVEMINDSSSTLISTDSTLKKDQPVEIPSSLKDTLINFNVTSDINYTRIDQFKTKEGKENFIEGWNKLDVLNNLIIETDSLRNEYSHTNFSEKKAILSSRVIELENQIIDSKTAIDNKNLKSRESELNYWNQATEQEKWQLQAENDSIKLIEAKKVFIEIAKEKATETIAQDTLQIDSTKIIPVFPPEEPAKTGNIVFKVQIGAYNTELPESAKKLYKKISMLRTIDQFIDDRNYTIYTIGELTNIKDAVKLQEQIRQESVKDAFVIAYKDGKRIPLNEALESTK